MKDQRLGDWLWEEWDGNGLYPTNDSSITYVTYEKVDLGEELVRRGLASCMQRDGVADSLSDGFSMLERATISHGYVGFIEGEKYPYVTDEFGETEDGDDTDYISEATWVECPN